MIGQTPGLIPSLIPVKCFYLSLFFFWAEGNFFHCPSQRLLLLEVIIEIHWSWKGAIILDYGFIFKKKKRKQLPLNDRLQ